MGANSASGVPGNDFRSESRGILYMDVDGVLLRRRNSGIFDAFELAPHCLEFLEWATAHFRCRWVTSRARTGWPDGIRRAFRSAGAALDDPRWAVLDQIEPAAWTINKSEALNPESEFWWIDDAPSSDDVNWLRVHGCEDRLVKISTDVDPEALNYLTRCWDRKYGRQKS